MNIPISCLTRAAADLKSKSGENPEYDCALVDLLADVLPLQSEGDMRKMFVASLIGVDPRKIGL